MAQILNQVNLSSAAMCCSTFELPCGFGWTDRIGGNIFSDRLVGKSPVSVQNLKSLVARTHDDIIIIAAAIMMMSSCTLAGSNLLQKSIIACSFQVGGMSTKMANHRSSL